MYDATTDNPLGNEKISTLLRKFAIPSIIAMVVSGCYNIVDQLFIGNTIGELGNAATNVAFPLTNMCLALGLMLGIGGAAGFNLRLGAGKKDEAPYFFRNSLTLLLLVGVILLIITEVWLDPILRLCGSPETVMPYARDYLGITAVGFPFFIFSVGAGHLLRADGSPNLIMVTNVVGTLINIGLDAWFMLGLDWGIAGAAWATVIGQFVAAVIQFICLLKPKTIEMSAKHYIPRPKYAATCAALGLAPFANQVSLMIVQIVLNNSLKIYGGQSIFGEEIPIAISGIILKVGTIFSGIVIGLSQGNQPVLSFNYGAKKYRRVKEAYYYSLIVAFIISILSFALYQLFPDFILGLFGEGSEEYFILGRMFFRKYLFFACLFFIQMLSANMFTAIGKPWKGMFLSLTRQIIYLLPLMLVFPHFMGIEGIIYAQPAADFLAIATAIIMVVIEFRKPEFRNEKGVLKEIFRKKPTENNL